MTETATQAAPTDIRPKRRSWFFRLTLIFFCALLCVIALAVTGSALMGAGKLFNMVSSFLSSAKPVFYGLQWSFIFLLWWYWDQAVNWLSKRRQMTASQRAEISAARNRIVLALVAIELFVVMGFPLRYINLN